MSPEMIAIVSASIAAGTTGIFALVAILLQRRADERRQIRELAVRVATENWQTHLKAAGPVHADEIPPVEVYLMHAMKIVSILDGQVSTTDQLRTHLQSAFDFADATEAAIRKRPQRKQ